jgi:single-stranded-DNA-specific exonuclease
MESTRPRRWNIPKAVPADFIERSVELGLHPVLAQIFYRRGYTTPEQALGFLAPYSEDDNPFRMAGMIDAVYRLRMAIRNGEQIAVYGDFDCDGVTSTVLLTQVLERLGANVRPYIPDRVDEGYGLNSPALKTLAEQGTRLVITVDCGIRSVQEVQDGNEYGLDMIITDHHSIGPELPPALAVINPKRTDCTYPEKMLAGVGLAYKVAQALYMEGQRRGIKRVADWRPEDWLDLVAMGTVADIAPLTGENRLLVQEGLKKLNQPDRAGLQALYGVAGVKPGAVNTVSIGFFLAPRINAAGRLRSALVSYELLSVTDTGRAMAIAADLDFINQERQHKTEQMQEWAEESMPDDLAAEPLLFAADSRFEQGVVGLVASRLTERYYRPSVVVQMGEDESHGSCRSIPEFHITHALDECDDLLSRYGGHAAAAGFTVPNHNLHALRDRLIQLAADQLSLDELSPSLTIDAEVPPGDISFELAEALARLEPTGEANRSPVLMAQGVVIKDRRTVGSEGRHLKLVLTDGERTFEGIAFRRGAQAAELPDRVDVAYQLEADTWNHQRRLQLNIQDIRPAEQE